MPYTNVESLYLINCVYKTVASEFTGRAHLAAHVLHQPGGHRPCAQWVSGKHGHGHTLRGGAFPPAAECQAAPPGAPWMWLGACARRTVRLGQVYWSGRHVRCHEPGICGYTCVTTIHVLTLHRLVGM